VSLLDSITAFGTGTYTVTRRQRGVFVDGNYTQGAATTLQIQGVVQPAREIQRVTAGRDMREREQNQTVDDVQIIHTSSEIFTRTKTLDPDIIDIDGVDWYVIRVEKWVMSGIVFWMGVITREMEGGAA